MSIFNFDAENGKYSTMAFAYGPGRAYISDNKCELPAIDPRAEEFYARRFRSFKDNIYETFNYSNAFVFNGELDTSGIEFASSGNNYAQFLTKAGSEYCRGPVKVGVKWHSDANSPDDKVIFGARMRNYSSSVPTGFVETGSVYPSSFTTGEFLSIAQNQSQISELYLDGDSLGSVVAKQRFSVEVFRFSDSTGDDHSGNAIVSAILIEESGLRNG